MRPAHRGCLGALLPLVLACGSRSELAVPSGHSAADGGSLAGQDAGDEADGRGPSAEASCQWGLGPPATYVAGEAPVAVAIGDFDGDGHPDLAVDNQGGYTTGDTLDVLHNTGHGRFTLGASYESEVAFNLVVGPFRSAHSTDVIVGCQLFPGAGDGTFGTPITYGVEEACDVMDATDNLVEADFDGDGRPDFAWASYDTVAVFLDRGGGAFTEVDTTTFAEAFAVADFDGDGRPDLAVVSLGYGNPNLLKILLNTGNGTFSEQDIAEGNDSAGSNIAAGDFDGDGRVDLVLYDQYQSKMDIRFNQGGGTFGPPVAYAAGFEVRSMGVGDVDGNGSLDVVMANYSGSSVDVFANRGDGTFAPFVSTMLVTPPDSMALGDLNADGHVDVALAGPSADPTKNLVTVLLSTCVP